MQTESMSSYLQPNKVGTLKHSDTIFCALRIDAKNYIRQGAAEMLCASELERNVS